MILSGDGMKRFYNRAILMQNTNQVDQPTFLPNSIFVYLYSVFADILFKMAVR